MQKTREELNNESGKLFDRSEIADPYEHGSFIELMESGFKHLKFDGKIFSELNNGEFVDHIVVDEEWFVQNWIAQFALSQIGGKNYFNLEYFNELTENLTKGIIVVDKDKEYLFSIEKLISIDYPGGYGNALNTLTRGSSEIAFIPPDEREHAIAELSKKISEITEIANNDPALDRGDRITTLIPEWFYKRHGIVPKAMKATIFIRDNYYLDGQEINDELLAKIQDIMVRHFSGDTVLPQEKELITVITQNDFKFEEIEKSKETKESIDIEEETIPEEYDPFSD